jgi:hypothetical protein
MSETRVPNREIVLNFAHYQQHPLHLHLNSTKLCPWTIARLGGSTQHSFDSIPLGILLW